jgi:DNA-binding transcriptional ArsR family regulator
MTAQPVDQPGLAFRALADPNRRAILSAVRDRPRAVGELAEEIGLSQQAASHHLRILQAAGLTRGERRGTRHLFVVNTNGLADVRSYLDGFWPSRLAALKAAVEAGDVADREHQDGDRG